MDIKLTPCESSNLAAHGYDPETKTLAVRFKGGGVWHYPGVPPEAYSKLCEAPSKGSYFAKEIRPKHKGQEQ